jgi:hypothetical protein
MANKRVHFAPKCELIVYKPEPEVAADDIILRSSQKKKKEKIKSKSQSKKGESELIVYQPEAAVDDAIVPSHHKKKDDKSDTKKSKSKKGRRRERSAVVARSSRSSKVDELLELYHQILSQTNPLSTHTGDNKNIDEEHSVSTCSTHDSTMTSSSGSTIRHNNQRINDGEQYVNQRNNDKEEENCIWPDIDDSASLSSTISSLTDSTMSTINSIISTESYLTYLNESDVKSSDIQTLTCQLELLLKEVREDSLKRDGR